MDIEDVLMLVGRDQEEDAVLGEIEEELALFDLGEAYPSPPHDEDLLELPVVERITEKQITLSPQGISFFKNDMFSLYSQDTLVCECSCNSFFSVTDCIEKGFFMKEGKSSSSWPVKYLFHTLCCTSDPSLRDSSCNSVIHLLSTSTSLSYIKNELYLALLNLGGAVTTLKKDVLSYQSTVIPPPPCDAPEDTQMTNAQLRHILLSLLRVLSHWLPKYKNHTSQDIDDLFLLFITVGLDPKVIIAALDADISTCVAHTINLYPTDEEFSNRLRGIVECVLEYCDGDLPSVLYLCQAYIIEAGRGKTLRCLMAFHQLRIHFDILKEEFVADVQAKDVADLLTRYFHSRPVLSVTYDSYYIIKLIDLSVCLDLIQPDQTSDLERIRSLVEERFCRSQFSGDDLNPTILYSHLTTILKKWSAKIARLTNKEDYLEDM